MTFKLWAETLAMLRFSKSHEKKYRLGVFNWLPVEDRRKVTGYSSRLSGVST
jgi:hypothetical protein